MFAIVQTLFNVFVRLFNLLVWLWQWFTYWILQVWAAAMYVVQQLINLTAGALVFILSVITDILMFVLALAVGLLPNMPEAGGVQGAFSLSSINRYLPISEVAALTGVWAVVFGAIGAYKIAKFIRGAG